jgi:hypothetical protein
MELVDLLIKMAKFCIILWEHQHSANIQSSRNIQQLKLTKMLI